LDGVDDLGRQSDLERELKGINIPQCSYHEAFLSPSSSNGHSYPDLYFYFYLAKNSSTMLSQLLPVLLVAAAPLIQAAATPNASNAITELAHSDLKEHDGNGFLNCVRSTNTDYHMYVDEGTMVVTRSPGQDIDLEEHDAPLKRCVEVSARSMMIAVENASGKSQPHPRSIPVSDASFDWLKGSGAQGLRGVRSVSPISASGLAARQETHYFAYPSFHKNCESPDLKSSYPNQCYSVASAYTSIQFENPSKTKPMTATIWPHHSCDKGNERKIVVPKGTRSACQNKTTYSYKGRF
ncbi:hypothetical protein LOZ53_002601, partial [Ophidiomyces ophidiicola]